MAVKIGTADNGPMMDINTTPLIDVMLVLLIMFIITIPMQTHAVKLDSPAGPSHPLPLQTRNEIAITDDGRVLWNGVRVDLVTLRHYLDQSQALDQIPELHVRPAPGARYALVDEVLAITKRAHVARMGIVGNEAYAHDF
jgi:biopolymer transport protein ExbD